MTHIHRLLAEFVVSLIFLTRLPLRHERPIAKGELSQALWAAPVVGVVVGSIGALVYGLAHALYLPAWPAATLALATTALVTGCLHEDGLADVADGFGGGATRERKLEIMRDSRIGTYGAGALAMSFMLRAGVLASLDDPILVASALVAAHAAARAGLPAFMRLVPPARIDGMSAEAGRPPVASAMAACILGIVALAAGLGPVAGLAALLLLAMAFWFMARLCVQQIQGQTGDVLGALEQVCEIAVLLVAAASWMRTSI